MLSQEQAELLTKAINRLAIAVEQNNNEVAHLRSSLSHNTETSERLLRVQQNLERAVEQNVEATRRLSYR